jgi:hypothetical protein
MLLGKCKSSEDQQLHTSKMTAEQVISKKRKLFRKRWLLLQGAITTHPEFNSPIAR